MRKVIEEMELRKVNLGDVYPDEKNPRRDFGDIAALAESLSLNAERPGEPFTPPLLVADGGIYRIVDGERRYRAMKMAGTEAFHAYVCDSMDEANAMVVMLATDDKQPLTEIERSRGVQQMLLLGVDPVKVDKVTRRTGSAEVRRAMRAVEDAAEDMSLDRLLAIAELDDMPEAVEALTVCREAEWERVARRWRDERGRRVKENALRGKAAALGLRIVEERSGLPDGWARIRRVDDPDALAGALQEADPREDGRERALVGLACFHETWGDPYIVLYGEPEGDGGPARSPEAIAEDNRTAEVGEWFEESAKRRAAWFAGLVADAGDGEAHPFAEAMADEFAETHGDDVEAFAASSGTDAGALYWMAGPLDAVLGFQSADGGAEPPSWMHRQLVRGRDDGLYRIYAEAWEEWMSRLAHAGYEAGPREEELRGLCRTFAGTGEGEGEGDE